MGSKDRKTKQVSGYLVYNYHKDSLKLRQTKPSKNKLSPKEFPVKVSFEVSVPKMDIPEISKTIEVPEARVREAVADMAIEPSDLESDYPEPKRMLVRNDHELLEEKFEEIGFSDVVDAERSEMLKWLRQVYSTEIEGSNREKVLELIEDAISEVRDNEA